MIFEQSEHDGVLTVKISGALDAASTDELQQKLKPVIASQSKQVVLNLMEVTFISSLALGLLIGLNRAVTQRGRQLRIGMMQENVRDILERCGADHILGPTGTPQSASLN